MKKLILPLLLSLTLTSFGQIDSNALIASGYIGIDVIMAPRYFLAFIPETADPIQYFTENGLNNGNYASQNEMLTGFTFRTNHIIFNNRKVYFPETNCTARQEPKQHEYRNSWGSMRCVPQVSSQINYKTCKLYVFKEFVKRHYYTKSNLDLVVDETTFNDFTNKNPTQFRNDREGVLVNEQKSLVVSSLEEMISTTELILGE